ncbi:MAG TPA: type IV pilus biogenesis/stability protein PilW [Burkholderiales bacterium]|jgi:type IV pilus assembly protein PilF|nr:type IV pilus biogenesis/stability protein PilW [Burkholderiales bacterium]
MKPGTILLAAAALAALLTAGCAKMGGTGDAAKIEPVTQTGDSSEPRNRAKIHTDLASLYFARGNMAVALEELRTATAADSGYAPAYGLYGLVYMELRENALAKSSFEHALSLAPGDPNINHNYGLFLCYTGREDESIQFFMKAVQNPLYPTPWRSYTSAGSCSMRKGKLKEAEEFFQRSLQLEPNEPLTLLQMGQIRYKQGNLDEARKYVSRFNKLVEPTAESLWLALRVERKAGERIAENSYAAQLRRRFSGSPEFQLLQRGAYD